MRTIKLLYNINDIKKFLSINNTYDYLAYDDSPPLEEFIPTGVWFILIDGSDLAGMINVQPLTNVLWSPHIFIYELYRGAGTEEWGIQAADYMREYFGAKKFLAFTPYKSAKKYAEKMGFRYIVTVTNSIKKNGEILDQYMLEME